MLGWPWVPCMSDVSATEPDPDGLPREPLPDDWQHLHDLIEHGSLDDAAVAAPRLMSYAHDLSTGAAVGRAMAFHDAGVGFDRVFEATGDRTAGLQAYTCHLSAAELFKEAVLSGRLEHEAKWARAVKCLCLVCTKASGVLDTAHVERADRELSSLGKTMSGEASEIQTASAYGNLGAAFSLRFQASCAASSPSPALRARAIHAFEAAIELFDRHPVVADARISRINLCVCLAIRTNTDAELEALADACLEQYQWFARLPPGADDHADGESAMRPELVLDILVQGIAAYISIEHSDRRYLVARSAAVRLLYVARPALLTYEGLVDDFRRRSERTADAPGDHSVDFLEILERTVLTEVLRDAGDADDVLEDLGLLWPPASPGAVAALLLEFGRDEAEVAHIYTEAWKYPTHAAGSDDAWALTGALFARIRVAAHAPLADLERILDLLASAFDEGREDVFDLLGFVASAFENTVDRWSSADLITLINLLGPWMHRVQEEGDPRPLVDPVLLQVSMMLLTRGRGQPSDVIFHARRIRSYVDGGGTFTSVGVSSVVGVYFEALRFEAAALRSDVAFTGQSGSEADPARALVDLAGRKLEEWDVRPPHRERLLALVTSESVGALIPDAASPVELEGAAEALRKVDDADWEAAATRLLQLVLAATEPPPAAVREAASEAVRALLARDEAKPLSAKAVCVLMVSCRSPEYAELLKIGPDFRISVLRVAVQAMPRLDERVLGLVVDLAMGAFGGLNAASDRLDEQGEAFERIAAFVFATRARAGRLPAETCGNFLAALSMAGRNSVFSSTSQSRHRTALALAGLAAACAVEDHAFRALALYAAAENARLDGHVGGAKLHRAVAKLLPSVPDEAIPYRRREAMAWDGKQSGVDYGLGPPPDPSSGQEPGDDHSRMVDEAERVREVAQRAGADGLELLPILDAFLADAATSSLAEDDRMHLAFIGLQSARELLESAAPGHGLAMGRLARRAVEIGRQGTTAETRVAIPLLEFCVLVGVLCEDEDVVLEALVAFRSAVNERLVAARSSADLIHAIETLGVIDDAARIALTRSNGLGLAVVIAEAGRAKLLSALSTGMGAPRLRVDPSSASQPPTPIGEEVRPWIDLIDRTLGPEEFNVVDTWEQMARNGAWIDLVTSVAVPWTRLRGAGDDGWRTPVSTPLGVTPAFRAALEDPGLIEILDWATRHGPIAWVFGPNDDPVIVYALSGNRMAVVDHSVDDVPEREDDELADVGAELREGVPLATYRALLGVFSVLDAESAQQNVTLVDCSGTSNIAVDVANGAFLARASITGRPTLDRSHASSIATGHATAWAELGSTAHDVPTIAPSFRLVATPARRRRPSTVDVCVLADPQGNLPATVLEIAAWSSRRDLLVTVHAHERATTGAFLDALATARLVVLSCHGTHTAADGSALAMADGLITYSHIAGVGDRLAAQQVVLSCCWGARQSGARWAREALGLASSLLSVGVSEVIAPIDPIRDLEAAVVGAMLAQGYSVDRRLCHLLGTAKLALRMAPGDTDLVGWADPLSEALSRDPDVRVEPAVTLMKARLQQLRVRDVNAVLDLYGVYGGRP